MINVMVAGNSKVLDGIIIETLSIVKFCNLPINMFIITMDLKDENPSFTPITKNESEIIEKILKQKNDKSKVTLIDYTKEYKEEMKNSPNQKNRYTPYALLRLYSDSMEQIPSKILYIDTDIVFFDNIEKIYSIDVSNYELAGVLDYYGHIFIKKDYLNSGVLLLNMDRIRETKMFTKARELVANKKMLFCDQDAINKLTNSRLILPSKFNEQHKLKKDTVIRHFSKTLKWFPYFDTQNIKPWQIEKVHNKLHIHEYDDVIDNYLKLKGEINL